MLDFGFKKSPEGLRPEHPVPVGEDRFACTRPGWGAFGMVRAFFLFVSTGRQAYFGRPPVFCSAALCIFP